MTSLDQKGDVAAGGPGATHDDHVEPQHHDQIQKTDAPNKDPTFQPPELIRNMTVEERALAEKRLVRKVDIRLLPMMILMYILNYLDRNNIAAAKLAGLIEDLNLSDTEFSTCVSILFVGYILMQVPSNLMLNKLGKPALYLPSCMVVWGVISTATAGCHNFGGLVAARFFLGFIEAAYFPGCLYYLSCWYTRKELGVRTTYLYCGSLISGAFSGLIAAGITGNMDGLHGLRAWRWLFIIEGVITIGVAIAAYFVLPNFPRTTSWLTEEETALAIWRLEEDIGQDDWVSSDDQSLFHGFSLAVKDVKTWVLLVLLFGNVSAASITNFFPSVVTILAPGDNIKVLLLTCPPYILGIITTLINAWHADRTGERFWHVTGPLWLAVVCFIISAATTNVAARYVSIMLMISGLYSGYTTALAWISNTLPRPPAKRAAALAFINAVSNATSIYSAYLYTNNGPRYTAAFIHNCVMAGVAIAAAFTLRVMLGRLNKKLDRGETVEGAINAAPGEAAEHGFRFRL